MKKLLSIFALLMCMSITWAQNVAEINGTGYATLQAAVDDAYANKTGDVTIELTSDITAYTVIKQKADLNLTIDGDNKNYTIYGQIFIDGMGRSNGTETLTITGVKFEGDGTGTGFYSGNNAVFVSIPGLKKSGAPYYRNANNYAHNVTVSNCIFTSTSTSKNIVGLKIENGGGVGYNTTLTNVVGDNLHSLAQVNSTDGGGAFTNCTATNTKSFINFAQGQGTKPIVISGCTFSSTETESYAVRMKSNSGLNIVLSDNNFTADNVIWLGENDAPSGTINVESGNYNGNIYNGMSASGTGKIVITGGTFSESKAVVDSWCPYGYSAVANDPSSGYCTVRKLEVAKIGTTIYPSLQDALDSARANMTGDVTIELLKNIEGYSVIRQKAGLNLTIEGNNDTITGQIYIDGDGRATGTETLTIQNVTFYGDQTNFYSSTNEFVLVDKTSNQPSPYNRSGYNYAHNVTFSNCDFTSTSSSMNVVAFKANSGAGNYNTVMNNVTGDNLHSLAQMTGTTGSSFDNCEITNSESFINVNGGTGDHNISNCTFTSAGTGGYAVRELSNSSAEINLSNNTFTASSVLQLGKNNGGDALGHINVESGTYNGTLNNAQSSAGTAAFVFTGGTFSEPKATVDSWCAPGYRAIPDDPSAGLCTVYQMYTLIYNANGGTGTMDTIRVKVDASVSDRTKTVADCAFLPATSTDIFAIWNTKADSTGISFNPGEPIVLVSDTTLYAIWREGYTISYDANGGTGTIPSQNKVIGVDIILSDGTDGAGNYLITKTDSTLYRWNTTPDEAVGSTNYALGETYSTDASVTLYAVWRLTLDMTMDSTDVVCYGENNGTDTVKIIGGEEPFQLVLSGTALSENDTVKNIMDRKYVFTNLKPGSYTVTLTDVLGKDTITGTFTIAQPDTLIVETMTVPEKPCPLMGVGEYNVSMTTTGGNGDNHFAWTGAEDVDAMATTVVPGTDDRDSTYTVTVTVTDKKGCTATGTETFTVSPVIADDGTIHSNTKMTIDTIKQGIMQGCDTIIRDFGTPNFAFTNPAIDENILDTIYNDIPTNYPDSIFPVGYSTIIWTAVDTCGHEVTGEQVIYIYHYPCPSVDDAEGNTYNGVRVGCLCWTDRNLVSTKYSSNGNTIPNLMSYVSETFPDATENVAKFGYLYDWYAAADTVTNSIADIEATYAAGKHVQGVCPNGWYLPTDEDFKTLESVDAKDLRSTDLWLEGGGTNATGFNAVPGGFYNCSTGRFEDAAGNAYYWSCHPVYDKATGAMIDYICEKIYNSKDYSRCNGFSVRCVLIYGE